MSTAQRNNSSHGHKNDHSRGHSKSHHKDDHHDKDDKHDRKHKDVPLMLLYVNPPTQLVFKGPFTDVVTSPLSLTNPLDRTCAFKIMVTSPKHYCCRPATGYVKPGETVELQVMVEPLEDEKKIEAEKHKFMVQATIVKNAPGDKKDKNPGTLDTEDGTSDDGGGEKELPHPHEFWQVERPKKDLMVHKLPVVFSAANQLTKEQLEATVRDLTSRAAAEAADEMEREREKEEDERREREDLLKRGNKLTPEERARLEMLQALAQIAIAKRLITGILRITPPEEVVFHGPFTEYSGAAVRLYNPADRVVYYKVMNTNPRHYMITPAFGILRPGETVVTTCLLEQQDSYARLEAEFARLLDNICLRDKFMIHAAYSPNATTPIPQFWKNLEGGQVHVTKLKVSLALMTRDELQKDKDRIAKVKADLVKKKEKDKRAGVEFHEDNLEERILRLAPLHELIFNAPYHRAQDTYLQLFNPSDQVIYYKVFATAPKFYMFKPSMGMLKPHQGIGVFIRLDAVKELQELGEQMHKVIVQGAYQTTEGEAVDAFWKRVDMDTVKTAYVKCTFRGMPPGMEKTRKKKRAKKQAGVADVILEDKKVLIDPEKELIFKGPFTEVVTSPMTILNDTDKFVYYKVAVNNNNTKIFAVKPNQGIVPPHKFGILTAMMEPTGDYKKVNAERHQMLISYCERDTVQQHAKDFWLKDNKPLTLKVPILCYPADANGPPLIPGAAAAAALAEEKRTESAAALERHRGLMMQGDKTACQYFGGPIEINTLPNRAQGGQPITAGQQQGAGGAAGGQQGQGQGQGGQGPAQGQGAGGAGQEQQPGSEGQPPIQSERAVGGGAAGYGGSMRAMDYKGPKPGAGGQTGQAQGGQGGARNANNNNNAAGGGFDGQAGGNNGPIQSERAIGGGAAGYGGSVRAMDQRGGGGGAQGGQGGARNANNNNNNAAGGGFDGQAGGTNGPIQSERAIGGGAAGYGGSVRAMDQRGGGAQNQGQSGGNAAGAGGGGQRGGGSGGNAGGNFGSSGGGGSGNAAGGANKGGGNAGGQPGGAGGNVAGDRDEPIESERCVGGAGGPAFGGSMRAMDYKGGGNAGGGSGGNAGGNYGGSAGGGGGQDAGGSGGGQMVFGPGGARGGSVMMIPGVSMAGGSGYALPNAAGGYNFVGGGGGGGGNYQSGNNNNNNYANNPAVQAAQGPQFVLAAGEKQKDKSMYMP